MQRKGNNWVGRWGEIYFFSTGGMVIRSLTFPPLVKLAVDNILRHIGASLGTESQGQRLEFILRQGLMIVTGGTRHVAVSFSEGA